MENKNNGRGIFYGVMGVATLVVAIIGATFAYFAANDAPGATNAVSATSSEVKSFELEEVTTGIKTNLIPVKAQESNTDFARYPKTLDCKDDKGNNICSVYKVTVTNSNNNAMDAKFSLKSITNSFGNLHYVIYRGATPSFDVKGEQKTNTTYADDGAVVIADAKFEAAKNASGVVELTNMNHVVPAGHSETYTILMYIQDTGLKQNETDANKLFTALFNVSSGGDSAGISGSISAGA